MSKCCFCGKEIEYAKNGNDTRPIKVKGYDMAICCNKCNKNIVIPTREEIWENKESSHIIGGRFNQKQYMKDLEAENKILEKALELACEKLANIYGECPFSNMNLKMPDYCEESCIKHEKLLCWNVYLKAKAKEELNINQSDISACCRGVYKQCRGFIWRFDNE